MSVARNQAHEQAAIATATAAFTAAVLRDGREAGIRSRAHANNSTIKRGMTTVSSIAYVYPPPTAAAVWSAATSEGRMG